MKTNEWCCSTCEGFDKAALMCWNLGLTIGADVNPFLGCSAYVALPTRIGPSAQVLHFDALAARRASLTAASFTRS